MSIKFSQVTHIYPGPKFQPQMNIIALDSVSFQIPKSKTVAIFGHSGSGKSTFLNILTGNLRPTAGLVFIDSVAIYGLDDDDLQNFISENIYYITQDLEDNLISGLSGKENAVLSLMASGKTGSIFPYFELMEIEHLYNLPVKRMSSGEKQLLSLTLALILEPKILVMDEPTSYLDAKTKIVAMHKVLDFCKEKEISVIFSTHDEDILKLADLGIGIFYGKFDRIIENPSSISEIREIIEGKFYLLPIDDNGTIVIPKFAREQVGIKNRVRMEIVGNKIILAPEEEGQ